MKKLGFILLLIANNGFAYDRASYGQWNDTDGNCLDTRKEILKKSAIEIKIDNCKITYGKWKDEYTGLEYNNQNTFDIDHVIPIQYADSVGASKWNKELKIKFYNDPLNLMITSKSQNRSKGSKGLSQWMPPNREFRCTYVELWQVVSNKYNLTLKPPELKIIDYYKLICK